MRPSEIRNFTEGEIKQKVNDLEEEIFNLRFQSRLGRLDNPLQLRILRKDIARLKTILREGVAATVETTATRKAVETAPNEEAKKE